MKITPAHSIEAHEMAEGLFNEWVNIGLPLSCVDESIEVSMDAVKPVMAHAFGWSSWQEMITAVSEAHTPHYIDEDEDALTNVSTLISKAIGFDYCHGSVINMVQNSGTGYSAKVRREMLANSSPWGQVYERKQIAEGIEEVSTARHGGIILSESRAEAMPAHLSLNTLYYEEDEQHALVTLAFPEHFQDQLPFALAEICIYSSDSVPVSLSKETIEFLEDNSIANSDFGEELGFKPFEVDEDLNRELDDAERETVNYLSDCVLNNKNPAVAPDNDNPTLQDWVKVFKKSMRVDGKLVRTSRNWKDHFYPYFDYYS